ncbi:MAG: hypothetical protein ACC656_12985 [Candidatus Heimdallarchaeota archaeon]
MHLYQATHKKLEDLAQSFDNDFSIAIDFLFFVFDSFTYDEKKNLLKHCPVQKENKNTSEDVKKKDEPSIYINLNKLLDERLNNLYQECEKINTISYACEFLLFVLGMIQKDVLQDLILQYINDSQIYEVNEPFLADKNKIISSNPIHVDPNFSEDYEHFINLLG